MPAIQITYVPSVRRPGDTVRSLTPPCSALNDPVAIVHIPLDLAPAYATKLYWTIDSASLDSAEFFNATSNRLEVGARVFFISMASRPPPTPTIQLDVSISDRGLAQDFENARMHGSLTLRLADLLTR
jgi:hypothetical protein